MSYLIEFHWAWLLAALVLGVIMGWLTYQQRRTRWMDGLVWLAALLIAVAAIIAISTTILGLPGYLLEVAVLMVVAYVIGCPLGWALRRLAFVDPVSADDDDVIPKPGYTFPGSLLQAGRRLGIGTEAPLARASGASSSSVGPTTSSESLPATPLARQASDESESAASSAAAPEPAKSPEVAAATSQAPATTAHLAMDAKPTEATLSGGPTAALSSAAPQQAPVESLDVTKANDASSTAGGTARRTEPSQEGVLPQAAAITGLPLPSGGSTSATPLTEPSRTSALEQKASSPSETAPVTESAESSELPLFRSSGLEAASITAPPPSTASAPSDTAAIPAITETGANGSKTTSLTAAPDGSASNPASQGSVTQAAGAEASAPSPAKIAALPVGERKTNVNADGPAAAPANGNSGTTSPSIAQTDATSSPTDGTSSAAQTPAVASVAPTPATIAALEDDEHKTDVNADGPAAAPANGTSDKTSPSVTQTDATSLSTDGKGAAAQTPTEATVASAPEKIAASPDDRRIDINPDGVPVASANDTRDATSPIIAQTGTASPSTDGQGGGAQTPAGAPVAPAPENIAASPDDRRTAMNTGAPATAPASGTPNAISSPVALTEDTATPTKSEDSAAQTPVTAPTAPTSEKMAALPDEHRHAGTRPDGWVAARDNVPDDLKRIKGIGPQNEGRLHGLGIWHFDQIAAWTTDNVKWVGSYLAFHGRIDREKWIDQAKVLASGQATEFSKRVAAGKVATSLDDGSLGQKNTVPPTRPGPRKR